MSEIKFLTHTLRLGKYDDIPEVIDFIKEEWNENHIYVKNREFFEYEHFIDGRLNGILAIDNAHSKIDGIMLFYQTKEELEGADFFGGIWRVSARCTVPMLGMKMVYSVKELTGVRGHNGIGINPETTVPLFRHVGGQRIGKLSHYYRLADLDTYRVAVVQNKRIRRFKEYPGCKLENIVKIEQLKNNFILPKYDATFPYKDWWYIEKRYFRHPIYQYQVYGIRTGKGMEGILVAKEIQQNGGKILRIVDFIGNRFCIAKIGCGIQRLIEEKQYEYVDFYEYGIEDELLEAAGFIKREEADQNIIPNYFEPFLCRNIDLWFHSPYGNFTIFKGDGDQDRPNIIHGTEQVPG